MFNTYLTILKKKIFSCLEKEKIFNKINNFYENKIQLMKVFIKKKTKENVWLQKFLKKILKEEITKKIENQHINNYRLIINAYNVFNKRKYKEALNIFEKLLSEERISFLKNKKFYKNIMFKTALCNFYLKKYDEAIFYFNLIRKNSNINNDIENITEMNSNKIDETENFFSDNDLISELNNEDLIFEKKLLKKLKQEKILSAEDVQKISSIINNENFFSEKDAKKILSNIDKKNMISSSKAEEKKNLLKDLFLEKEEDAFFSKLSNKKILSEKEEKEIYSKLKKKNLFTINNEKFLFSEKNKKFILLNLKKIFSGKEKQSLFSKLKSEETKDLQTKDLQTKDLQNKDLQNKDLQTKDLQTKDLQNKDLQNTTYKDKERKATSKQPLEVTLFNLGMCYYKQANDYNFDQQNNLKSIKVFLKFIKSYPNSLKLNTAKKMLYKAVLNLKKKQISIGNFYFKRKKYKASLFIFKDNIENFKKLKKIFSIQNEYIYMIISQYKLEKSTNQFDFKKTLKLYNDYIHNFYNFENQFFYEKKLNLDYRIKNLFSKIERQLFFLKIYNKYIDEYQRI
ncbi:MAG: outer membrane protein assembly factor BamD [Candidatus Karelsulcia muelleri]